MKVNLHIEPNEANHRIDIYTDEMTDEIKDLVQDIQQKFQTDLLYGKKDDAIFPLPLDQITRFYIENKIVFAEIGKERYRIDKRIYELEKMLSKQFIRISQSEIIHLPYLKKLRLEMNGLIQVNLTNGIQTYSSRRYVKKIKEALQL